MSPCTQSDHGISSLWIEYLDNQDCRAPAHWFQLGHVGLCRSVTRGDLSQSDVLLESGFPCADLGLAPYSFTMASAKSHADLDMLWLSADRRALLAAISAAIRDCIAKPAK